MINKTNAARLAVLIFGLQALCLAHVSTGASSDGPIALTIDRSGGQLKLGLRPNPLPGKDVIEGLSELLRERGSDYPVIVLLDSRANVADLVSSGIASKVGFTNIREFVVYRDRGIMAEINFGPGIPITDNPGRPRDR